MSLSRVANIVVAVLMLHLNLVLGDPSCRRVAGGPRSVAAREAHHGHELPKSGGDRHAPCDILAQPLCCQALTTRPTTGALDAPTVVARIRVPRTAAAHTSEPIAPETPPPKV